MLSRLKYTLVASIVIGPFLQQWITVGLVNVNGDMGPTYCLDFVSYPMTYLGGGLVSPLYYIYYIYVYIYIPGTQMKCPLFWLEFRASFFWGPKRSGWWLLATNSPICVFWGWPPQTWDKGSPKTEMVYGASRFFFVGVLRGHFWNHHLFWGGN